MSGQLTGRAPGRLSAWWRGVAAELRWMLAAPFEVPKLVVFNVVLVLVLWALGRHFGLLAHPALVLLPAAIANWAFADVPATNLYGSKPQAALDVIGDPRATKRLISARNGALWLLVAPATAVLSFALGRVDNEFPVSLLIGLLVLVLPFGFLGMGSVCAPALPYHPLPWRERLSRRDTWWRWGLGVCAPYILVGPACYLMVLPGQLLLDGSPVGPRAFALVFLVVAAWSLFLRWLGIRAALALTARREQWLREFLADPTRG